MEKDFKIVATKVSPHTYTLLKRIAAKKKVTLYEMVQIVCELFVRFTSDSTNLTPDMEEAIMLFEHLDDWSHAFNLCDYTTEKEVTEAVYFVGDKNKKGVAAVHVKTPYLGDWTQDVNVQRIFERVVCLMFPTRYKRLRQLAIEQDCKSLIELIDTLCSNQIKEDSLRQIREGFEDAARSDYGTKASDAQYRRSMHRTVDSVAQSLQRTIQFTEDDEELAQMEVDAAPLPASPEGEESHPGQGEGARPHGYEEL